MNLTGAVVAIAILLTGAVDAASLLFEVPDYVSSGENITANIRYLK